MGMVLRKILDQYVSSYQIRIKLVIRLGNNEALKTLKKTLTLWTPMPRVVQQLSVNVVKVS